MFLDTRSLLLEWLFSHSICCPRSSDNALTTTTVGKHSPTTVPSLLEWTAKDDNSTHAEYIVLEKACEKQLNEVWDALEGPD